MRIQLSELKKKLRVNRSPKCLADFYERFLLILKVGRQIKIKNFGFFFCMPEKCRMPSPEARRVENMTLKVSVEVIYEIITFKNVFCIIFLNL